MRRHRRRLITAAFSSAVTVLCCLAGALWITNLHAATQAAHASDVRLHTVGSSDDQLQQLSGRKVAAQQQGQGAGLALAQARRPSRRGLDVVMAYSASQAGGETLQIWRNLLALPNIDELDPYVFLYCKDETMSGCARFFEALHRPGEVVPLPNIGREQHTFLTHIVSLWGDLAAHTFFTQALPVHRGGLIAVPVLRSLIVALPRFAYLDREARLLRRAALLSPQTGMLAMDRVDYSSCEGDWDMRLPRLLWGPTLGALCPPDAGAGDAATFLAFLKGGFVASRERLQRRPLQLYQDLLARISAPDGDPIHGLLPLTPPTLRSARNPLFGHVLERAWNLILDCRDSHPSLIPAGGSAAWLNVTDQGGDARLKCDFCDWTGECAPDACQCLDA